MDGDPVIIQLSRETRSSIELKFNAKRDYEWAIKLYFDLETDAGGEMIVPLAGIQDVDRQLRELFLVATGG